MTSLVAPRVSIVTVVFNARELLKRTVQAVDALDYPDIEHVIVDGGSTDGTTEILARPRAVRVISISEPDAGIYDAMNKGIKMSTGDYLWFINAGDTPAAPDVLSPLSDSQRSIDVLFGDTNLLDDGGSILNVARAPKILDWRIMTHGMNVSHQSIVVRKSIAPLYDLRYRYIADQKWIVDTLRLTANCIRADGPMSNYLMGGLSYRQFESFLFEKIRYSFNELPALSALAITASDLVKALRFYASNAVRRLRARYRGP